MKHIIAFSIVVAIASIAVVGHVLHLVLLGIRMIRVRKRVVFDSDRALNEFAKQRKVSQSANDYLM